MTQTTTCDVLIVGGGPAGLACAQALGARACLVHQDKQIGHPVRTSGGSWQADLQALGVPEALYQVIDALDIRSDHERSLRPLTRHKGAVLDITGLYQWLARAAVDAGAHITTDAKFLDLSPTPEGHLARIRYRDGVRHVQARYVVDASGTACAVLQAAGLGQPPERRGIGIEYEYPRLSGPAHHAALLMGAQLRTGYGWIFPAPGDHLRVGVGVIHPETDQSPREILEALLSDGLLERHGYQVGPRLQVNAGILPSEPYDSQLVFDRIIRVGDSGNFATPTVGEGIRIAMEFGQDLGGALAQALTGDTGRPLRAYERRCRKALRRNYALGFWANQRMAGYGGAEWDRSLRRLAHLDEEALVALLRSEFSWRGTATALRKALWHKLRRSGRLT